MKKILKAALQEAKTRWLQSRYRKPAEVNFLNPVVSLTFDDVPLSAYTNGLPILDAHQVKATFYVSLGIKGEIDPANEKYLGPNEISHLLSSGHEIGCHTFSHYRLSTGSSREMALDAAKNVTLLEAFVGVGGVKSFSFPFGELTRQTKRHINGLYQSSRSSRPGINNRKIDLNCLRAISMGRRFIAEDGITAWLDRLQAFGGWAIFYTHGITNSPGAYDLTPDELDIFLRACKKRNITIAPVNSVLEAIRDKKTVSCA